MNGNEHANFIRYELDNIKANQINLHGDCVACHMIFRLKEKLKSSEQDAADLLSEVLTSNSILNREFIDVVEKIHMKDRGLGGTFSLRDRESKDSYLEAYFSNVLDELTSDLITTSHQIILRKLLLSYLALYLAQTIGVDHHAATEELYYLLRKDDSKDSKISQLVAKFEAKIKANSNHEGI
ncbi:MAG: hypothetical protein ACT4N5_02270 [Nitrosopumilaceae archaeon]